ncbi:MAG TPA: anthranilate phosphoribosyltransferase, partial [Thermodesulfovibrionales bacterium]|nr:anthranilate phosphoribosyltransferase [Thermodesulfovibrionales bacterium]
FGFRKADVQSLSGGDKEENAKIFLSLFNGEKGPKRDVVLMNSAAALVVADKAKDLMEAVSLASELIDSGRATQKLQEIVKITNAL